MLSKQTRVFVSFCSQNHRVADTARFLMLALEHQSIDVYTYERPDNKLAVGTSIENECKAQLVQADFCIALICTAGIDSFWTRLEIDYAQSLKRPNYLLYVNLSEGKKWPKPLMQLRKSASLLETNSDATIAHDLGDEIAMRFCVSMNFPYEVPNEDVRIPLKSKIKSEVFGVSGSKSNAKLYHLDTLFMLCDEFDQSYKKENHKAASKTLKEIIAYMEKRLDIDVTYYPRVILLAIKLERSCVEISRGSEAPKVIRKCKKLIVDAADKVDANVYGALGNAYMQDNDFQNAHDSFTRAEDLLEQVDSAIVHNKAMAAAALGSHIKLMEIKSQIQDHSRGACSTMPGNLERLRLVDGIVRCQLGNTKEAVDVLTALEIRYQSNIDLVRQFVDDVYDQVKRLNDPQAAHRIYQSLRSIIDRFSDQQPNQLVSIIQRRAHIALDLGLFEASQQMINRALAYKKYRKSVTLLVDAALIYHAFGDHAKAKDFAEKADKIVDFKTQPKDLSLIDFDLSKGIAAWLLKKDQVAQFCFERAGMSNYDISGLRWVSRRKLNRGKNSIFKNKQWNILGNFGCNRA